MTLVGKEQRNDITWVHVRPCDKILIASQQSCEDGLSRFRLSLHLLPYFVFVSKGILHCLNYLQSNLEQFEQPVGFLPFCVTMSIISNPIQTLTSIHAKNSNFLSDQNIFLP